MGSIAWFFDFLLDLKYPTISPLDGKISNGNSVTTIGSEDGFIAGSTSGITAGSKGGSTGGSTVLKDVSKANSLSCTGISSNQPTFK